MQSNDNFNKQKLSEAVLSSGRSGEKEEDGSPAYLDRQVPSFSYNSRKDSTAQACEIVL